MGRVEVAGVVVGSRMLMAAMHWRWVGYDIQGPLVARRPFLHNMSWHLTYRQPLNASRLQLQTSTAQAHFPMFAGIAHFAVFRFQPHQTPRLTQSLPKMLDPALNEDFGTLSRWPQVGRVHFQCVNQVIGTPTLSTRLHLLPKH